jgi:hypothetical protein
MDRLSIASHLPWLVSRNLAGARSVQTTPQRTQICLPQGCMALIIVPAYLARGE